MKKIIKISALCALIALTAFSMAACGLSGAAVDADTFNNAVNNYKAAFSSKSVTVEHTYRETVDITFEAVSLSGAGNSNKKTIGNSNSRTETTYTAIYDGNSAYIKEIQTSEMKVSSGSNTKSKSETETYFTVIGSFAYTVEKGMDGDWQAVDKTRLPDGKTFAEYSLSYFLSYAFSTYKSATNFEDYDYGGGRYNLKQSIIDSEKIEDTASKTYTYGNHYRYVVFDSSGLYAGGEEHCDGTVSEGNYPGSSGSGNTATMITKSSYTKQTKVTYSGKVTLPGFTNDLD